MLFFCQIETKTWMVYTQKQLARLHMFPLVRAIHIISTSKVVIVVRLFQQSIRFSGFSFVSSLNVNNLVHHLLQRVIGGDITMISWEEDDVCSERITRGDGYYSVPTGFGTVLFVFY